MSTARRANLLCVCCPLMCNYNVPDPLSLNNRADDDESNNCQGLKQETQLSLANCATHFRDMQWLSWPPTYTLDVCRHTELRRSRSKSVAISRETPKFGSSVASPLEMGARLTPIGFHAEFDRCTLLVRWYKHTYRDPPKKLGSSYPAFQGHSRSSELIRIDWVPMTTY